jgi:hypothetical protein
MSSAPQPAQAAQDARLLAVGKAVATEVAGLINQVRDQIATDTAQVVNTLALISVNLSSIESRLGLLEEALGGGAAAPVRATRPAAGGAGAGSAKGGARPLTAPKTGGARARAAAVGDKPPHNTMIWYEHQMASNPDFQETFLSNEALSNEAGRTKDIEKFYVDGDVPEENLVAYWKAVGKFMWKKLSDKEKLQLKHQYDSWKKTQAALHEAPPLGEDGEGGDDGAGAADGGAEDAAAAADGEYDVAGAF